MDAMTLVWAFVAIGAFAQSVTGLGFALVAAPAVVAVFGPRDGVTVVIVLGVVASLVPLTRQWRDVRLRDATVLLVPTLLATPVVVAALAGVDTSPLAVAAGVAVLIGVGLLWRGGTWKWLRGIPGAIATGIASAVLNVVGGVGGPPLGIYASNAGWEPQGSRATLQFFFLVQGVVTALVIGFEAPPWTLLAALLVGGGAGALVAGRIPAGAARTAVLVVAALGGASLVVANV